MTNTIERSEYLESGPAEALAGLLGVPLPDLAAGAELPLLWHWVYLLERPPQDALGADGHVASGGLPSPPGPGRRRMFAGGRVRSHAPLLIGRTATRRSAVLRSTDKQGRSGALTFVTVTHEISQNGRVVVTEEQDIVYREATARSAGQPARQEAVADAGAGAESRVLESPAPGLPARDGWVIATDPVMLFRFSALTYNSHRIHYDRDFARNVEGYPGLVVHGPLQALAMAEAARRLMSNDPDGYGPQLCFSYRLTSPLFDHQGLVVNAAVASGELTTSARDRGGRGTASGTLTRTA